MSEANLREFYRHYIAALNAREFDVVGELVAEDVDLNDVPHKRSDVLAALRGISEAVPDFLWPVQDLFAEDDRIAARLQDTGTPIEQFPWARA